METNMTTVNMVIRMVLSTHQLFQREKDYGQLNGRSLVQMSLMEAHSIVEEIEDEIMHHTKYVAKVIVDIEPEHVHE